MTNFIRMTNYRIIMSGFGKPFIASLRNRKFFFESFQIDAYLYKYIRLFSIERESDLDTVIRISRFTYVQSFSRFSRTFITTQANDEIAYRHQSLNEVSTFRFMMTRDRGSLF